MEELLLAIVKTFKGVLTSVEDIGKLRMYDSEEDDFVDMLKPRSTSHKIFLRFNK